MHKHYKKQLIFAISFLSFGSAWSQAYIQAEPKSGRINSPYSRFGIGNTVDMYSAGLRGMGGTATGYAKEHTINAFNPASYTYLSRTTLEFAIGAQSNTVRIGDDITRSSTFTINHLNIGIPLIRTKMAMNIGFTPISRVYYNAMDSIDVIDLGRANRIYNGEGNLNFAFLGLSGGTNGFSVGVNAGYLFGNIRNSTYFNIVDSNTLHTRNSDFSRKDEYGGLYFKAGLMYKKQLAKEHYFSVGATAGLGQKINMSRSAYAVAGTGRVSDPNNAITDTVEATYNVKGQMQMPMDLAFGAHFGKGQNYDIGLDVQYADWSKFSRMGQPEIGVGQNAYRLALGGEIIPNVKATAKQYFSAITYRMGLYYGKDYFHISNTDINYYGLTIGAQLPMRPYFNQSGGVNLSLDLGNRGTLTNNLAKEFFIKFTFGLRFNDIWFQRPKYD